MFNRTGKPGLALRPERLGGSAALLAAIGPEDREVPLIAANEPERFRCLACAGLQERGELVFGPGCDWAGKTLEPIS